MNPLLSKLPQEMYEAYHERLFGCVPIPFENRTQHVRDTWHYLASMSIGFVHGADTSDSTPDLNPSVN